MRENPDKSFLPEKIKSFFELTDEFFFELDVSGKILNMKNGDKIFGNVFQGGENFLELCKLSSHNIILNALRETLTDNKIKSFEAVLTGKFNKEVYCKIKLKSIPKTSQTIILGTGKDISLIKNLEGKIYELNEKLKEIKRINSIEKYQKSHQSSVLEELSRMKENFISNISHEFRTPLASIIGFTESILTDTSMSNEHQKEFLQIILAEGKRLSHLINDVFDLTVSNPAGIELNKTHYNFIPSIKKILLRLDDEIKRKNLVLTKEIPASKIIIYADRRKIMQAFSVLLENAIKHTGRGGRVSVIINDSYKEFEVIITDTGIGIPDKSLPTIFQKYYNDNKFSEGDSKRGLGLVFVKEILDLHKGSISVLSKINEGTTFIVKLLKEE